MCLKKVTGKEAGLRFSALFTAVKCAVFSFGDTALVQLERNSAAENRRLSHFEQSL